MLLGSYSMVHAGLVALVMAAGDAVLLPSHDVRERVIAVYSEIVGFGLVDLKSLESLFLFLHELLIVSNQLFPCDAPCLNKVLLNLWLCEVIRQIFVFEIRVICEQIIVLKHLNRKVSLNLRLVLLVPLLSFRDSFRHWPLMLNRGILNPL